MVLVRYAEIYIAYFAILVPLLFQFSVLCLSRHILKTSMAISFVLFVSAFAPAVILNLSDFGLLELASYSFLFAAAYLSYLKRPDLRTYLGLLLSAMLVAVAFNFYSLFWNAIFIPLFVLTVHWSAFPMPSSRLLRRAWNAVPWPVHLGSAAVLGIGLLALVICFLQGKDVVRTKLGTGAYSFDQLEAGSPVELFCSGTPELGFEWTGLGSGLATWTPLTAMKEGDFYRGYSYCGLLVLPLAIIGLIFGRFRWRIRFLILLGVLFLVMLLGTWSPLFALLLRLPLPFQACNHYSDEGFRGGVSMLLILCAGYGLEQLVLYPRRRELLFFNWIVIGFALISIGLGLAIYDAQTPYFSALESKLQLFAFATSFLFVFYCATVLCVMVVAINWLYAKNRASRRMFAWFLVVAAVLDISTAASFHVRTHYWPKAQAVHDPDPSRIGMDSGNPTFYADDFLALKSVFDLKTADVPIAKIPALKLYGSVSAAPSPEELKRELEAGKATALPIEPAGVEVAANNANGDSGYANVTAQSYNSLDVQVRSGAPAMLFWRDAYSPYWHATVNNEPAAIYKAFLAFKAVAVPAGASLVHFQFRPPFVGAAVVVGRLFLLAVFGCWLAAWVSSSACRRMGALLGIRACA